MSRDVVILYWGRYSQEEHRSVDEWRSAPAPLSQLGELALQSHLRLGHQVLLYSHQMVEVPDGVGLLSADGYITPSAAWNALTVGHRIAYVSDLVRFRGGIDRPDAVLMDLDQVVLNPLPPDPCYISSIPIRQTGILALKRRREYKLAVRDGSWDGDALCDFPVRVGAAIGPANRLVEKVEALLAGSRVSKDCGVVMRDLRTFQEVEECVVHPPIRFSPVPPWAGRNRCYSLQSPTKMDGKTVLFGYTLPPVETVLASSSAVSHWFESSISGCSLKYSGFWDSIPSGCLLDFECQKVLGGDWRKKLCSKGYNNRNKGFGLFGR